MPVTYQEALAYIASLQPRGWRLGLDRMQEFALRAGLDEALGGKGGPQFIHVAGTNGKGSVTAFLQSMLVESGYRTGAFFSPYVVDPRERVQFGRSMIEPADLAELTEELRPVAEAFTDTEYGGITEFEFKTALGFLYWKRKGCAWVALEVGLGGRLDATNVVTPRASVIVSIGLDHTHILGDTHAKIAFEKAGVIKSGVPVIVGQMPEEAREVIESVAREREARVWLFGREVQLEGDAIVTPAHLRRNLTPGLVGPIQRHNLALAIAAMDASGATRDDAALERGAASARAPGRFQRASFMGRTVIFDGAHNPDAARNLRETLARGPGVRDRRVRLVTNMLTGHDPLAFYRELADLVVKAYVVPVDFFRALPPDQTAEALRPLLPQVDAFETPLDGIVAACREAADDDVVLVTGSNYVVGAVLRATGNG